MDRFTSDPPSIRCRPRRSASDRDNRPSQTLKNARASADTTRSGSNPGCFRQTSPSARASRSSHKCGRRHPRKRNSKTRRATAPARRRLSMEARSQAGSCSRRQSAQRRGPRPGLQSPFGSDSLAGHRQVTSERHQGQVRTLEARHLAGPDALQHLLVAGLGRHGHAVARRPHIDEYLAALSADNRRTR
jgi:hypothetical protein